MKLFEWIGQFFYKLRHLLESKYNLSGGKQVGVQKQVIIFLWIVGHDICNRDAQERFQHSSKTTSKYFYNVLNAATAIAIVWIKSQPKKDMHPYVKNNPRYYPHFKGERAVSMMLIYSWTQSKIQQLTFQSCVEMSFTW